MEEFTGKPRCVKNTTSTLKSHIKIDQFEKREHAFANGKRVAAKWARCASYQEMKDALPRPNFNHDRNYFAFMRSIFFRSIEKICPDETLEFKLANNETFLKGWREGVIEIWNYRSKNDEDFRLS
jgi:hypothetical protein